MVADLSQNGSTQMRDGSTIRAQTDLDPSKMQSMSATQKLMAPALSEFAAEQARFERGREGKRDTQRHRRAGCLEFQRQVLLAHDYDERSREHCLERDHDQADDHIFRSRDVD